MRSIILLMCLLAAVHITPAPAQVCQGDIFLSSQEEVNAFACETVDGDLYLEINDPLDFEALSLLTEVTGTIHIAFAPDLYPAIRGLRNLGKAGGLEIRAGGGSSWDTHFEIGVFTSLDSLGTLSVSEIRLSGSFPALTRLNGLSMYASYFMDISWLENIAPIHSLRLNTQIVAGQNEVLMAKVKEGGDVSVMYSYFEDFGGLQGTGFLNTLEITGSSGKSFDGLTSLDSTNYFLVTDTEVSEGCCGLASYLRSDPKPVAFQFSGNSCSLNEILENCVRENVCEGDVVLVTQEDFYNFNCTRIVGNLVLGNEFDANSELVTSSLSKLKEVIGNVNINRTDPTPLPLIQLESIGGELTIGNEVDLGSFSALKSVRRIKSNGGVLTGRFESIESNIQKVQLESVRFINPDFLGSAPSVDTLQILDLFGNLNATREFDFSPSLKKLKNGSVLRVEYVNTFNGLEHIDSLNFLWVSKSEITDLSGLRNLQSVQGLIFEYTQIPDEYCILYPALRKAAEYSQGRVGWYFNNISSTEILANCGELDSVCEGSIRISTTQDILEFDCEIINGDLIIDTGYLSGFVVSNLATLNGLRRIDGDLIIRNNIVFPAITISDLQALEYVGGSVIIESNPFLGSIQGLSQLTYIGGDLIVRDNPKLTALGLFGLQHVNNVEITNNPQLGYCCDIDRMMRENIIQGEVNLTGNGNGCTAETIINCPADADVCGGDIYMTNQFDADKQTCEIIEGDLYMSGATPLKLDSLYRLKEIEGRFNLEMNDLSFEGMHNLERIGGIIRFSSYNIPTTIGTSFNLDPLVSLRSIGGFYLVIDQLYGKLNLTEPMNNVLWGYVAHIDDISWIERVPSIDTVIIQSPGSPGSDPSSISIGTIPNLVSEGGVLEISGIPQYSLDDKIWASKTHLKRLALDWGVVQSLNFMSSLQKVNELEIRGLSINSNDICGAYDLLKNGEIIELNWFSNRWIPPGQDIYSPLSVQDILDNCAPEVVNSLSVYPNPSGDPVVKLSWQEKAGGNTTIQVLDNNGREVMRNVLPSSDGLREAELNTTSLEPGFYLIRIIANGEVRLKRFVKS